MTDALPPLFSASRTKLKRARQFIQELHSAAEEYVSSEPATGYLDPGSNEIVVNLAAITDWPGAIVGDAVHNMRSALDLMASELARMNGKSDKNVYFPFANSAGELDDAIKSRSFNKAGEDAVDLIKQFAPYRGGNTDLRAIHDLDIEDKHTVLILTTSQLEIAVNASYNINNVGAGGVRLDIQNFHYVFPNDRPFANEKVIPTLEKLVAMIEGILESFSNMVVSRC